MKHDACATQPSENVPIAAHWKAERRVDLLIPRRRQSESLLGSAVFVEPLLIELFHPQSAVLALLSHDGGTTSPFQQIAEAEMF